VSAAVRPIPSDTAVVHIGPHKTGTTALQHAMNRAREQMLAQGVRLAGQGPEDADGVRYAIGGRALRGGEAGRELWERIKSDLVDVSTPRRIFSSETFASASARGVKRVIDDIGPVDVVISARPLAEILSSQYSQFVQRGYTTVPFEPWAKAVLDGGTDERSSKLFWRRHRYERHIQRWGELVGHDRITVLVVDGVDRSFLPRSFEQLLALRPGTLTDQMSGVRTNRALTVPELELLREWHELCADGGIERHSRVPLAWRLCDHLRRVDPDPVAPRPTLPRWGVAEANALAAASAQAITASGVRIVGDLEVLSAVPMPD
jgi:hypothetical protein